MNKLQKLADDFDFTDWDAYIATPPPPKSSKTIKVIFKYAGRSKPISVCNKNQQAKQVFCNKRAK